MSVLMGRGDGTFAADVHSVAIGDLDDDGAQDLDGSGTVDFDNLLIVLDSWGPCE